MSHNAYEGCSSFLYDSLGQHSNAIGTHHNFYDLFIGFFGPKCSPGDIIYSCGDTKRIVLLLLGNYLVRVLVVVSPSDTVERLIPLMCLCSSSAG